MNKFIFILITTMFGMQALAADLPPEARIEQAMFGDHRSENNINRNRYRHPVGTLTFLGLEDGMTVMEIWPGAGWCAPVTTPRARRCTPQTASRASRAPPPSAGARCRRWTR